MPPRFLPQQRRRRIVLSIFCLAILLLIGVGALFITLWRLPLQVNIHSELDSNETFTWGDRVLLTAHLSSGIEALVSYSWSLIPSPNSTQSIVYRSGATLEFVVNDDFYFAVVIYKVRAAYFGILFPTEANYTLVSYRLRNDSYLINSSAVISWNVVTQLLVLRRSQLPVPDLKVGDNLIHTDGLFLVNISRINTYDATTYSLLVANNSIAEAFAHFTADDDLVPIVENENYTERGLRESKTSISFTPFSKERSELKFSFTPEFSFTINQGSEVSIECTFPALATQLDQGNLIGQSYRISCQYKYNVTGEFEFTSAVSGEYTYYLFGGDDSTQNGFPQGKRFSVVWKKLSKILHGVFKQVVELRVPLRFKVEVADRVSADFSALVQAEFVFDYVYTQSGWTIAPTPPIDWTNNQVSVNEWSYQCNTHVDLAIGLALSHEFAKGFAEVSAEFLVHLPWYDEWDPTFKGPVHGVPLVNLCNHGYRLTTTVVGFSIGFEIGLSFWKFGISKSYDHEFGATLLYMNCEDSECSAPYQRFTCQEEFWAPSHCVLDWDGKYQGLDQCKAQCEKCTTCNNPACCNCPGHTGPCSGACSFQCPGDFGSCCT